MKFFVLKDNCCHYDESKGFVIAANSEEEAREMAGWKWTRLYGRYPDNCTCEEIKIEDIKEPIVLLEAENNG